MSYLVNIILFITILCFTAQLFIAWYLLFKLRKINGALIDISRRLRGMECVFTPAAPLEREAEIENRKLQEAAEMAYAQGVSNIMSYDIGKGILEGE